MDRSLVLSSTAVHLGEHGSIHDLAESEIYRWANVRGYVALHRTQPIYLSENRCMMHLRLTGVRLGMEQVVVYTRLSGGMARVDRLWHPLSERENDPSAAVFAATAAALSNLLIHKKFIYILSTLCYNTIVYVTNGAIAPF